MHEFEIVNKGGEVGLAAPTQKSGPMWLPECGVRLSTVKWLHCAMFVLVTSLCLTFSDDDN